MQKEEYLKQLGKHLKKMREERDLTQVDLANAIGKDRQSYQRIELGVTNTTIWYLAQLAKALQVTVKDIVDFENK